MMKMFDRQFVQVNILLLIAILMLSGCIWLAYHQVQQFKTGDEWLVHTHEVINESDKVALALSQTELLVQNNIVEENTETPLLFKVKSADITQNLERLYQSTADNPEQQRMVLTLRGLAEQSINLLQQALNNPALTLRSDVHITLNRNLRELNAKIESAVSNIQEQELVLQGVIGANYKYQVGKTNLLLLIAGLMGNALLLMSFILLNYNLIKRKHAEEEKQKLASNLERIINSSQDLIASIDNQSHITAFNHAYSRKIEKLFGKEVKLGMNIDQVLPHGQNDSMIKAWLRALQGEVFTIIHRFDMNDHEDIESEFYESTYSPILDLNDNVIGACHIMRNVTERHKAEQMKTEFVTIVGRELRTPLTAIRSALGAILQGAIGDVDGKTQNMLRIAQQHCERLIAIINSILDIEKIESGEMHFQFKPDEINQLVKEAIAKDESLIKSQSVNVTANLFAKALYVQADHDKLLQAFSELLTNTIKCSSARTTIVITVTLHNEVVMITVSDAAKMPTADQLIQESAIHRTSHQLALNVSKAIIERHHGAVHFFAENDSAFYIELPLWKESEETISHEEIKLTSSETLPSILYIEDDKELAPIINSVLLDKAKVLQAATEAEALNYLQHESIDLVLLDLVLPNGKGVPLLPAIKEKNLPMIVFSAHDVSKDYLHDSSYVLIKSKTTSKGLLEAIRLALREHSSKTF